MKQEENELQNKDEMELVSIEEGSSDSSISTSEAEPSFDNSFIEKDTFENETSETTVETATEPKKKRNFKILPYAIVLIPSISLGVFGGVIIKKFFGDYKEVEYSSDYQTYYPNYEKVYSKYKKAKDSGVNFTSVLTPTEMAESALCLIQKEDHVFAQGVGEANASIVHQEIRSTVIQNGDLFFEESLSLSNFVDLADRMYQAPNGDDVSITMYPGVTANGDVTRGKYDASKVKSFNKESYITNMGRLLSTPTSYIVSEKTVIEGSKEGDMYGVTSSKTVEGGYVVDVELDPIMGVSAYVIQMETISDLYTKPTFDYCHLTFELDEDLNLKAITSYERYMAKVKMGASSKITGVIRVVYERGGDYKIPELDEPCSYRSEM